MFRYQARADDNGPLREQIVRLAHRHRRHGYRMIHLRLRLAGWQVNVKRVRRLYREAQLMVKRRKRKKVPLCGPATVGPAEPPERSLVDGLCL